MYAVKIRVERHEADATVTATFEAGESEDSPFAFTFYRSGTIAMPAEVWDQFALALRKGARRPLIVLFEEKMPQEDQAQRTLPLGETPELPRRTKAG